MNQEFLNHPDDVNWLAAFALRDMNPPEFGSYLIYGNEDDPSRLDLYSSNDPRYSDTPVAVYAVNALGYLELQEKAA